MQQVIDTSLRCRSLQLRRLARKRTQHVDDASAFAEHARAVLKVAVCTEALAVIACEWNQCTNTSIALAPIIQNSVESSIKPSASSLLYILPMT